MNKMILKSATILTAIAVVAPIVASADTTLYNSNAGVNLQAGNAITNPVDPENPTNPVTPVNPEGPTNPVSPGTAGPLSIDFASNFEFGTQNISSAAQVYYAHPQLTADSSGNIDGTRELYTQVTDNRGTAAGWTLSVSSDSQFHLTTVDPSNTPENGAPKGDYLTGAQLEFTGGKTETAGTAASQVTNSGTISTAATNLLTAEAGNNEGLGTNVFDFGTDNNGAGDYDSTGILTGNAPFSLAYAPTMQTYVATKSPVTLSIPANTVQLAGRYTTNLIWSLSETPEN